ncbi:MAG: serine hydrolase domain-containing protein [Verrucomicrobiota bacterium]
MITRHLFLSALLSFALIGQAKKPEAAAETVATSTPVAAAMQAFVDKHELAGAVTLVWSGDKLACHEAVGFQDLESKTPMSKGSLFWIASMTKPVTALGIMMLVEEGKLSIDDPVSKHLPEFRNQMLIKDKSAEQTVLAKPAREVTIKDLLTHTSGLVGAGPLESGALDVLTLKEAVLTYGLSPLQFEPGSQWSYCNPGINTLGRIIEVVSGEEYAKFLEKRLFKPLKMKDTTFWPSSGDLKKHLATSYKPTADGKGLEPTPVKYLTEPYSNKKRAPLAAGGLFSTAEDLLSLYRMLLNGGELDGKRYLKAETLALMIQNHTGDLKAGFAEGMGMGLGFQIVKTPVGVTGTLSSGTYGHGGAHGTQGWIDPVKKTIHILLIQRAGLQPTGDASPIRQAFHEAFAGMGK